MTERKERHFDPDAEYRELRNLVSVLGGEDAQVHADGYLLNKFVRENQGR